MTATKGVLIGFLFAFLVMGYISMQRAMPNAKSDRIYEAIKVYSPYIFEKRLGGLTIVNKITGDKEKPSAAEVLHRLDELDKAWGSKHLTIQNNDVLIMGENNQTVVRIFMENEQERAFVKSFFGI